MKRALIAFWVLFFFMTIPQPAAAQGPIVEPPDIIEPDRPPRGVALQLIEERVEVTIRGQVATTHVSQTFRNPSEWSLEGEYLFPLPPDAAISDMDMTVNGEKLEGELMTADQARDIYEEIVRRQMDPALLEWLGNGLFRTHIFPIPPGETRLIELEYEQLLTAEGGLFEYRFPLRQGEANNIVPDVSVSVTLEGEAPLRAIYSPSHEVDLIRDGDSSAIVGWEGRNVTLDEDFSLYWSVSPEDIELNLLSFKESGEDGFFLLLAAPTVEADVGSVVARDVVVVLDVSGSMEGEKMEQARAALDYILSHLNPEDRFNVIAFSTGTRAFSQQLQPVSEAEAARRWVSELQSGGSTDISRALLEALDLLRGSERSKLLLFMTDGLPTAGIVDSEEILRYATENAPDGVRLFSFGVGYDVDTILLDALAAEMQGTSSYVAPEERIEEKVSAFYEKVSAPVLADVRLDWSDAQVEEIYPSPLPDLFAGQQLVVAGRYRESGPVTLTLDGTVNGESKRFIYDDLRLAGDGASNDGWLPRLWATRKIGTLLQAIRLHGESEEVVDEIIDLAIRYGIVTPYTTFLVDENTDFFSEEGRDQLAGAAPPMAADASGAAAVEESEAASDLASSDRAAAMPTMAPMMEQPPGEGEAAIPGGPAIRAVGSRSFVQRDGRWVDTRFTEGMERVELLFGSDEYFQLASSAPEVAQYLSIGVPLMVVINGTAYEILENPDAALTQANPAATEPPVIASSPTASPEPVAVAPDSTPVPDEPQPAAPVEQSSGGNMLPLGLGLVVLLTAGGAWLLTRRR